MYTITLTLKHNHYVVFNLIRNNNWIILPNEIYNMIYYPQIPDRQVNLINA